MPSVAHLAVAACIFASAASAHTAGRLGLEKRTLIKRSHRHMIRKRASTVKDQPEASKLAKGTATADEGCNLWVLPSAGDHCYSVIKLSDQLTLDQFYGLNPSIDSSCSNLSESLYYCIDTDDSDVATKEEPCTTADASASLATPIEAAVKPSANSNSSASYTSSPVGNSAGLLSFHDQTCGSCGATSETTSSSGPNGAISFLNCGISKDNPSSGWTPPNVHIDSVVVKELDHLADSSTFAACSNYINLFKQYGAQYNVPPIFLASFALQESSCNPSAVGGGGEQGLMQITHDKCGNAPGGNCQDSSYNIQTGAAYFRSVLDNNNQNVLAALGAYNGWSLGLTFSGATAAANSGCCRCQNNLDYLHGFLNCWAQGISGSNCVNYNNLAVCG